MGLRDLVAEYVRGRDVVLLGHLLAHLELDEYVEDGVGYDGHERLHLGRKEAREDERARRVAAHATLVLLKEAQVQPRDEHATREHDHLRALHELRHLQHDARHDEQQRQVVLLDAHEARVDEHGVGHDLLDGDGEAAEHARHAAQVRVEQVGLVERDGEHEDVDEGGRDAAEHGDDEEELNAFESAPERLEQATVEHDDHAVDERLDESRLHETVGHERPQEVVGRQHLAGHEHEERDQLALVREHVAEQHAEAKRLDYVAAVDERVLQVIRGHEWRHGRLRLRQRVAARAAALQRLAAARLD